MIPFAAGKSAAGILNDAVTIFLDFQRWASDVSDAITNGLGLQAIFDLSRDWFASPTFAFDPALNTLAYSCKDPEDAVIKRVLDCGGVPMNWIEDLARSAVFRHLDRYYDLGVYRAKNVGGVTLLLRTMQPNEKNVSAVVAVKTGGREPSLGEQDFIRRFLSLLEPFFRARPFNEVSKPDTLHAFMADCVEGRIITTEEMHQRAILAGVPYKGRYGVACIKFESFNTTSATYVLHNVQASNPFAVAFLYHDEILIINDENKFLNSEASRETIALRTTSYLESQDAFVGISNSFDSLFELRLAHEQAAAAIRLGRKLHPEHWRFLYRDYAIYQMIDFVLEKYGRSYFSSLELDTLQEYDNAHSTNNLELLACYLSSGCSTAKTAEKMFLHRNSVIYRVKRIEEILGENLDEAEVRMNLSFAYMVRNVQQSLGDRPAADRAPAEARP